MYLNKTITNGAPSSATTTGTTALTQSTETITGTYLKDGVGPGTTSLTFYLYKIGRVVTMVMKGEMQAWVVAQYWEYAAAVPINYWPAETVSQTFTPIENGLYDADVCGLLRIQADGTVQLRREASLTGTWNSALSGWDEISVSWRSAV